MKKEINMRKASANERAMSEKCKKEDSSDLKSGATMYADSSINTDPMGSYTGVPMDAEWYEKPVQDVDDL